jgi:transposase-like protein
MMAISFKGAHFPKDIILMGVRWYVAYPLSYRHVEELLEERGVPVDHATIQRWVVKYSPLLEEAFHRRKRSVWVSWRMDETYIKVKGQWYYLYRAVDKYGQTIDFLLTEHRDAEAALRFLKKAIRRNSLPETITIDGSDANEAAIKRYNEEHGTSMSIRQVKYLNKPKLPLIESMSFFLHIRGETAISSPRGRSPWTTKLSRRSACVTIC